MVRPYAWLLDRVGTEGIKLTSAGYLSPVHVEAAAAELGLAEEWVRAYNRESRGPVVLVRLGALVSDWHGTGPERPTADGAVFACAALRTWPSAS